jgi:hypothetical protein
MALPDTCLPTQGYLRYRIDHGQRTSKACDLFHLVAGHVELAAALGKQVWIEGAGEKLYLSLAVLLLGPSGAAWKSTTLAQADRILRKLGKVNLLPRTGSKEAFEKALTQPAQERDEVSVPTPDLPDFRAYHTGAAVLLTDELSLLQDMAGKDYNRDMRSFLTSILGRAGRVDHATMGERRQVADVAVTAMACAPDAFFIRHTKPADFIQGLLARFDFIWDEGAQPIYGLIRHYSEPDYNKLADQLAHQTRITGPLDTRLIEPAAKDFDRHLRDELGPRTTDEPIRILDSRRLITTLRYAALYHLAESDTASISREAWGRAQALSLHLRQRQVTLISQHYAATPEGRLWKDVLAYIPYEGGRTRREIVRRFHLYEPHKLRVLTGLEQAELIVRTGRGVTGEPVRYYRARPEGEAPEESVPTGGAT